MITGAHKIDSISKMIKFILKLKILSKNSKLKFNKGV